MIVYSGLAMDEHDRIRIPYRKELEDTNALLISGGKKVCGIFYLHRCAADKEYLYVMKDAQLSCEEADLKGYDLLCFRQQDSDRIFSLYYGMGEERAERISVFRIPLMDVEVNEMIYGTCVDVTIVFENQIYYIPAVIVDTKGHSAPGGYMQTGETYAEVEAKKRQGIEAEEYGKDNPLGNNIIEWYVEKEVDGKNKSTGLNDFSGNSGIIIYRDERALEKSE